MSRAIRTIFLAKKVGGVSCTLNKEGKSKIVALNTSHPTQSLLLYTPHKHT